MTAARAIRPDGQQIAFIRQMEDGTAALYVVSSLGGEPRRIAGEAVDADWAPDGRRLCLTRWVRGQGVTSTLLEQVESDGSNLRTIARLEGLRLRCPRWSPDGQYIALVKGCGCRQRLLAGGSGQGLHRRSAPA
jgi:Tol biopolymer transport system component